MPQNILKLEYKVSCFDLTLMKSYLDSESKKASALAIGSALG